MKNQTIIIIGFSLSAISCGVPKSERVFVSPDLPVVQYENANGNAVPGGGTPITGLAAWNAAVDRYVPATYEGDIKPTLDQFCVSCHSGDAPKAGLDLSTLENVKAKMQGIVVNIKGKQMPPKAGDLPDDQKQLLVDFTDTLENWSRAPSNFASNLTEISSLSYNTEIAPLTDRICATCHSGATPKKGFLLDSKAQWSKSYDIALAQLTNGTMPPGMDSVRRNRLIELLKEWNTRKQP